MLTRCTADTVGRRLLSQPHRRVAEPQCAQPLSQLRARDGALARTHPAHSSSSSSAGSVLIYPVLFSCSEPAAIARTGMAGWIARSIAAWLVSGAPGPNSVAFRDGS